MAKIVQKGRQLEQKYGELEQNRADNWKRRRKRFGKAALITVLAFVLVLLIARFRYDAFADVFIPSLVVLLSLLFIEGLACAGGGSCERSESEILASGIRGEMIAADVLSALPDDYTAFRDATVEFEGKKSEIDYIVVGASGAFVIEVKNHNGRIEGDVGDLYWTQYKIGRGGTLYANKIYSPVKQVGAHIYRLANYLRQNGVDVYVEGAVFFTNPNCTLKISGSGGIPVYSNSRDGGDGPLDGILRGRRRLTPRSVDRIRSLLYKL